MNRAQGVRYRVQGIGCRLRVVGQRLWVTGYGVWVIRLEFMVWPGHRRRKFRLAGVPDPVALPNFFFFFINLQPLKKLSTTNYAPFALDSEPRSPRFQTLHLDAKPLNHVPHTPHFQVKPQVLCTIPKQLKRTWNLNVPGTHTSDEPPPHTLNIQV